MLLRVSRFFEDSKPLLLANIDTFGTGSVSVSMCVFPCVHCVVLWTTLILCSRQMLSASSFKEQFLWQMIKQHLVQKRMLIFLGVHFVHF
jgi:hypothetical protein